MARGWESKSVEQQQASIRDTAQTGKHALTSEEAAILRRKGVLMAARAHTRRLLSSAANQRYRKLLQEELASLDEQIAKLNQI